MREKRFTRFMFMVFVATWGALLMGGLTKLALNAAEGPLSGPDDALSAQRLDDGGGSSSVLVSPEVQRCLESSAADDPLHLIVQLRAEPGAYPMSLEKSVSSGDSAWRTQFVQARRTRFDHAKVELQPVLDAARRSGALIAEHDLWLVNSVALEIEAAAAQRLLQSSAVAEVRLDHYVQYLESGASFMATSGDMLRAGDGVPDEASLWGSEAIRAPQVWHTFAVTGTGAVVAVMDTGVDWQHPDLMNGYQGHMGKGVFEHAIAWYDAVNEGTYPYDDHGHGTHVAGTAVGSTTGVAPGARWIGVKVLNGDGYGYDSWILRGFQWLLAPNGDPSLAPDVLNASWSNTDSRSQIFLEAIQALEEAGIFPAFASGNSGPHSGSVGSPASNPGIIAVGATDPYGEVASFSGRGPSPWDEVKPLVVAPGVNVLSTAPGGIYLSKSGTSMATPHLVGLGALLRSVSPTLSVASMAQVITETARPLTLTTPNNESGWGEVDAYQAILRLIDPAFLVGTVAGRSSSGYETEPISGATITAWPDKVQPDAAPGITTVTDAAGTYRLALTPGRYAVRVSAFGYQSQTLSRVDLTREAPRDLDVILVARPSGGVCGTVSIEGGEEPPSASVQVRALGTPATAPIVDGAYALSLPEGVYTLELRGLGYRVATATVTVTPSVISERDFVLRRAPKLLLVDEGAWYYGSQIEYWMASLDALNYAYNALRIKDAGGPPILSSVDALATQPHAILEEGMDLWSMDWESWQTTVATATLGAYDIVLWSSPSGSPGLVGASSVLSTYLASGGRLLLSGQDVAYYDGGGTPMGVPSGYFADRLGAQFVADSSETAVVMGSGPFEDLHLNLTGGSGADNQTTPDVVAVRDPELASLVWSYADGGGAGVMADTCVPYRALSLAFGFEGIADAADRHAVLGRSIDWLSEEMPSSGLTVNAVTAPMLIGLPGEQVTHVLKVRHTGYAGVEEQVNLTISGEHWATQLSEMSFRLAPCDSALVTVTVTIPEAAGVNAEDRVWISATSDLVSEPVSAVLTTKTPASILLVDDDRWYPMEDAYREALDAAGIGYDLWDTRSGSGGRVEMTSPSTETLLHYPLVVWFTGYDWYAPIEAAEATRLLAYLDQGGKLLLSSQDFAYHHQDDALLERLGVMLADWADQANEAVGVVQHPAGQAWAPEALHYPFPNWSHTIEPLPSATPVVRGQHGQPIGIAMDDSEGLGSRTLFYAFPLEALSLQARSRALANGIGWLSPLGSSAWRVSPSTAESGDRITFELTLRNTAGDPLVVEVTHDVPVTFDLCPTSLPDSMIYDPVTRRLTWCGPVSPAASISLTWEATWLGAEGSETPTVTLSLPAWELAFVREARFYGQGLDLGASRWQPIAGTPVRTTEPQTLTYTVFNDSAHGPAEVAVSFWLMMGLGPITATTPLTQGLPLAGWHGVLDPFASQDVTLSVTGGVWDRPVRIDALLTASGGRWEDSLWLAFEAWGSYLPLVLRSG